MCLCMVRCRWEKEICNQGERMEGDGGVVASVTRVHLLRFL
jgi:hypothetical protein